VNFFKPVHSILIKNTIDYYLTRVVVVVVVEGEGKGS